MALRRNRVEASVRPKVPRTKENGGPEDPPLEVGLCRRSEVERDAGEDVATQGVVGAREGVAVAVDARAGVDVRRRAVRSDDRRGLVEDVVDAEAELIVVADPRGEREIEVALR